MATQYGVDFYQYDSLAIGRRVKRCRWFATPEERDEFIATAHHAIKDFAFLGCIDIDFDDYQRGKKDTNLGRAFAGTGGLTAVTSSQYRSGKSDL